ncbi:uncharacterized protein LOC144358559 [Saccoglossus kowalevskii]
MSYEVRVLTKTGVPSDQLLDLRMQLIGDTARSDRVTLKPDEDTTVTPSNYMYVPFQAGQTDTFTVNTKYIGDIKYIKLDFSAIGWRPQFIRLIDKQTSKESHFPYDEEVNKWEDGTLTLAASYNDPIEHVVSDSAQDGIKFIMGPILGCRAISVESEYQLCAILVTSKDQAALPPVTFTYVTADHAKSYNGTSDEAIVVASSKDKKLWRYDWSVPWHDTEDGKCTYTLPDGRSFTCYVPSSKSTPRFAFASCAGLTENPDTPGRNIMWQYMRIEHQNLPIHLLIMGGDQVYADEIFKDCPSLVLWSNLPVSQRADAPFTDEMKDEIDEYFFNLYCTRWREHEPAWMYARVPSIMMWDDHDIIDGYGSRKMCPVFDGIYDIGRKYMLLFQLRCLRDVDTGKGEMALRHENCLKWLTPMSDKDALDSPLSYYVRYGDVAFLLLDIRSERTQTQILSNDSWDRVTSMLDSIEGLQHLFIVAVIPPIFPSGQIPYTILRIIPGIQELEDDFLDQWDTTDDRTKERDRFFSIMVKFSEKKKTKVSVLSGDVHLACWGKLHTESGTVINMPTSSAIVNKPPPKMTLPLFYLRAYSNWVDIPDVGRAIMSMLPVGTEDDPPTFVATQNFMTYTPATAANGKLVFFTKLLGKPSDPSPSKDLAPPIVFTNFIGPFEKEKLDVNMWNMCCTFL